MPSENRLREENSPQQKKGNVFTNMRTQKVVRIARPGGSIIVEIPTVTSDSRPDENGNYTENIIEEIRVDRAGNIINQEGVVAISHTGLVIDAPEKVGHCTSWLHRSGSRIFLIEQDGRMIPNGGICSKCDFKLGTVYIAAVIICLGAVFGIWHGAGVF
jgi:hypothetical protein